MGGRWYEAAPTYPLRGSVEFGWSRLFELVDSGTVVAIEGPPTLCWEALIGALRNALPDMAVKGLDMRSAFHDWETVLKLTSTEGLRDDPDFERLPELEMIDLIAEIPGLETSSDTVGVVYGPGAALVSHDQLWYLYQPKRVAEKLVASGRGANLGQWDEGMGTLRRLFYVDWPILDRHRDLIARSANYWVDIQDIDNPRFVRSDQLVEKIRELTQRPFRTRTYFNSTPWGGHWAQQTLGVQVDAENTGLGYELIAPESGVLLGTGDRAVEVPLQLMVGWHPDRILGPKVSARFGSSFPIRFDYLDTVGGEPLSVHCHPREDYMWEVFGWPYTQHETYYIMKGGAENSVFLGLREDADPVEFRKQAERADRTGEPFDITRHVASHPALEHQLFLIPAGTPHGSGKDNVVLEISATPYLYSLRFYDWLRWSRGEQRAVHVSHAFENLDTAMKGSRVVAELIPEPSPTRSGHGWDEYAVGVSEHLFFEVHRLHLDKESTATATAADRFHVLNVVEGDSVTVVTASGYEHPLAYAETLVVPAAVDSYLIRSSGPVVVLRAQVADVS